MNTQTGQEYQDLDKESLNKSKMCTKHKTTDDQRWIRFMKIGEKTGCHQRYDRSFFFHGKQFPVCARCTGLLLAYLISIICYLVVSCKNHSFAYPPKRGKQSHIIALFGCLTMLIDWIIQAVHVKESTNKRRVITGFLGGLGLMHFYLTIYNRIGCYIGKKIRRGKD